MTMVTEAEEMGGGRLGARVPMGHRRKEAAPGTSASADRSILHPF
jgi:hypothetical protein